jgi:hypothetical protein
VRAHQDPPSKAIPTYPVKSSYSSGRIGLVTHTNPAP